MASLATVAAVATIGAAVFTVGSTIYAGSQKKQADYVTAARDEAKGREEFAAAQREGQERQLESALIESRQQAVAAASGGGAGADAPTIVKLMTETRKRGEYGVQSVMYAGESRKQGYFDTAAARRRSGDSSFLGSILSGIGSLAGGVGDFAASQN